MSVPGDQRIREAERTAYHEVGVQPHERRLELVAGGRPVTVRIMEVGNGPATDGPPTVLLLHGVMSASVLFAPLPYLRQRHVVLVDWPGHGLSGRPSLPHRPDAFRSYTGELFHPMFAELGYRTVDIVATPSVRSSACTWPSTIRSGSAASRSSGPPAPACRARASCLSPP